jgi:hypothetical protein
VADCRCDACLKSAGVADFTLDFTFDAVRRMEAKFQLLTSTTVALEANGAAVRVN